MYPFLTSLLPATQQDSNIRDTNMARGTASHTKKEAIANPMGETADPYDRIGRCRAIFVKYRRFPWKVRDTDAHRSDLDD